MAYDVTDYDYFPLRWELICRGCGTKRSGTFVCEHGAHEHDTVIDTVAAHVTTDCPKCGPLMLDVKHRPRSRRGYKRLRERTVNTIHGTPRTVL